MEFIEGGENNLGIREQMRYITSILENLYRKVHNIENQLYKIDIITNHLEILESKIYLLSTNKNDPKIDDKKKKSKKHILYIYIYIYFFLLFYFYFYFYFFLFIYINFLNIIK